MAAIQEEIIDLNMAEEVGGEYYPKLELANIKEPTKFHVVDAIAKKTKWGVRVDYVIEDKEYRHTLSSWNFMSKKKFKAADLVGLDIILTPLNDKKVMLSF